MRLFENSIELELRDDNKLLDITLGVDCEDPQTQGFVKEEVEALAYYLLGISQSMKQGGGEL